jgi:ribosome-binding factor A
MSTRPDRVAEAIRQEVSVIVHELIKDPRVGFITITRVEIAPDLRLARVFFSVLGNDADFKKMKDALESAHGFIRKLVTERINLKFSPDLLFKEDHSSEYSVRIQQVLDEIKENNEPRKGRRTSKKK